MPIAFNPTPRPISCTYAGFTMYLKPGEKKRIPSVRNVRTGETYHPELIAQKYLSDNGRVGLQIVSDSDIDDGKVNEKAITEAGVEKFIEFCKENISAFNNLNMNQVAQGNPPLPTPKSLSDLMHLYQQIKGNAEDFLNPEQIAQSRKNVAMATKMDAIKVALETGDLELAKSIAKRGIQSAGPSDETVQGAPSDEVIDQVPIPGRRRRRGKKVA